MRPLLSPEALGARCTVIAYLIVTSLINVSLGYALAVYVNRARLRTADSALGPLHDAFPEDMRTAQPTQQHAPTAPVAGAQPSSASSDDRRTDERNATWIASDETPSPPGFTMPLEASPPSAAAPTADATMASEATMMEKDLLAGIEEFRLQLAKIKGHEGEPLASALGVTRPGK